MRISSGAAAKLALGGLLLIVFIFPIIILWLIVSPNTPLERLATILTGVLFGGIMFGIIIFLVQT